jgi:hypothetical protein
MGFALCLFRYLLDVFSESNDCVIKGNFVIFHYQKKHNDKILLLIADINLSIFWAKLMTLPSHQRMLICSLITNTKYSEFGKSLCT